MRPSIRFDVFKRDAFTCRYCGKRSPEAILEVDHVLPVAAGGADDMENLVTSCFECNRGKAARLLSDVPPEERPHEKAVQIAEHELQIAELNHWRAKQRQREDHEIDQILDIWRSHFVRDRFVRVTNVRGYLRRLGQHELIEVIEWIAEHVTKIEGRARDESAWRMFMSMCSRRVSGDVQA